MPDLIELQKDKTLFEAKTEEVSLHKQIKQQENQIPPPEPEYERKQKQLSWTIAPQLQEKEMLKGAERAKFAKNEQLEQSMNEEEQILLKREEQSFQSLEKLFQEIHQPARSWTHVSESSPEDQPGDGTGSADFSCHSGK